MPFQLPRPGKAIGAMLVAVLSIWVLFALRINWSGANPEVLRPFIGISEDVLHGQVWRLFTAPLIHYLHDPSHVLTTLLGLYFLGPSLEDRWGPWKMLLFLFGSAAFAFTLQIVAEVLVLGPGSWYGGLGMVEAIAVAWALNNRNGRVMLFFVVPVSGMMLLLFIFGMSVLNVIAHKELPEGMVTPFGGMLAGYLFGDASPLRHLWLKLRLRRLQAETAAFSGPRRPRGGPPLRVIPGGGDRPPKDRRDLN